MRKYLLLIIILTSTLSFANAQKSASEEYVISLFEKDTKLEWVKHYKGRIDDLTDISLTLGFDGENCKGQLTYLRSSKKFKLVGKMDYEDMELVEMDNNQQVSGLWSGKISGKIISGTWNNHTSSIGGKVLLEEVEKEVTFPSYCGDNKWIRKYNGKISGEDVEMILQKESNHRLSGVMFFHKKLKSFDIKGQVSENENVLLEVKEESGKRYGSLEGFLEGDFLKLKYKNLQNKEANTTFSPDEGLTVGCAEYTDYSVGYDITYPKTTNATFNKWIDEETAAWVKACRNKVEQTKRQNPEMVPAIRAKNRGFAWYTVDYFSKNIISGYMTYTNSWTPGHKVVSFNFDLDKNRRIYLEDIFSNDKDYKKFIKNYVKKEIKNNKQYENPEFKKWIKANDFSLFTIRRDGICFSTRFSMLYGQHSVTIPLRQLQPFLKKKNSIWKSM